MKKGIDYLKELTADEQVLFLKNISNIAKYRISLYLLNDYPSAEKFILSAFAFTLTPEGSRYWWDIVERVKINP